MSIYDYAIKMEADGRKYYLDQVAKSTVPQLARIWQKMADDELKHLNLFTALRDGGKAEFVETEASTILSDVKNVFQGFKDEGKDVAFADEVAKAWMEARSIEEGAEKFYREKAAEAETENEKRILSRIADEEHAHYVAMDNIVAFLQAPQTWLADAEWNNLDY